MQNSGIELFQQEISGYLPEDRIMRDYSRRFAYSVDASFYRLVPKLVLFVDSEAELCSIIQLANKYEVPYTFRAAGTSLSGQAQSDSVLISLTDSWRYHKILDLGQKIKLGPGVIGADANRYLLPYGRKIGPDPASINSCKIGGIAANNSSGMCCGVKHNSYHTLDSIRLILHDGSVLDTGDDHSLKLFRRSHGFLLQQLAELAQRVKGDSELAKLIETKYRLKNTTGYGLNSLIDYDDPIDILAHLMIGSEGSLGFISSITYNTVPEYKHKATTLVLLENIEVTCQLVSEIAKHEVDAVELLDYGSLRSVAHINGIPNFIKHAPQNSAVLLIEVTAANAKLLQQQTEIIQQLVSDFNPLDQVDFSQDKAVSDSLWSVRKQTFPAVGAIRENGTTVIIEDVAFPVARLAEGVKALQSLLEEFNYHEAIIFGHALDGNMHFVFTQRFDDAKEVARYEAFMAKVCDLVAGKFNGSLKAEHGTGRNMAPFVELEWGKKGYQVMEEIKHIFDPHNLINPGVIINQDKSAHVKDLKELPAADDIVDKCIECGFCESVCPSNGLSLTPRQRIATYRQITKPSAALDLSESERLQMQEDFQYLGVDSCAATGLCAEKCPVNINTGELILNLRAEQNKKYRTLSAKIARYFNWAEGLVRWLLTLLELSRIVLTSKGLEKLTVWLNRLTKGVIPAWHRHMPKSKSFANKPESNSSGARSPVSANRKVVYFPSCASRNLGSSTNNPSENSIEQALYSLLQKADVEVIIPENVSGVCCGMPFNSKGQFQQAKKKASELEDLLLRYSENGQLPIIFDTSPCKLQLRKFATEQQLKVYEPFEYIETHLVPRLQFYPLDEPVMLHVTCSSQKMGLDPVIKQLANRCSKQVIVPEQINCCGFAGDKGFTLSELNQNALKELKRQVPPGCSIGVSNSRTCEIGLSLHSGINYQSIIHLVDAVTTPLSGITK